MESSNDTTRTSKLTAFGWMGVCLYVCASERERERGAEGLRISHVIGGGYFIVAFYALSTAN